MTSYTFMKTGNSNATIDTEDLFMLIGLFTSNAIKNADRHIKISNREIVTKEDLKYGMIYETFEFLSQPNLNEEIQKIKHEILSDDDDDDDDNYEDLWEKNIVPDEETTPFRELDKFEICKIPKKEDRDFISKMYSYNEKWKTWIPETPFEKIVFNAINKSY